MNPPKKKDRVSRSWTVIIGKGQHKGRGWKLECWLAEIEGKPVALRIIGGGPLQLAITDTCEAISIGLAGGVPWQKYAAIFKGRADLDIRGPVTGDPHGVQECMGVMDYISRALSSRYGEEVEQAETLEDVK